jgi:putative endonuclease
MKQHNYYVYMMASESGTFYPGFTNNLERRVSQHRNGTFEGFSKTYGCKKLVYYEYFRQAQNAIDRETQLKKWRREKKENLIRSMNPGWVDLAADWWAPE